MDKIFNEIRFERERQNEKWGEQNHSPIEWIGILTEEVGEASKEAVDFHFADKKGYVPEMVRYEKWNSSTKYREELIQVAAVAVQMIECLDRNGI